VLEANKKDCENLLAGVSDLLRIPWEMKELYVYLVDPFTGEPIERNTVCLGIGPICSLSPTDLCAVSYFFISHEAAHILVWDLVRTVARRFTTEAHAEYVDEAVMNLIMNSVLRKEEAFGERFQKAIQEAGRLGFPPTSYVQKPVTHEGELWRARHEERNHYITYYRELLQDEWNELLGKGEVFSEFLEPLLRRKIKAPLP